MTLTLTFDRAIRHTVVHHSSTSTYIPNVIQIEETFCGRMDVRTDRRTDISPLYIIRSTLGSRPKNKLMSVMSHYHKGSPVGKRNLRWEVFAEKVGFEPGVKEWLTMMRAGMMREMGWQVDEEVNRDNRLTKWIWKLIAKTRWCISKWALCDFPPTISSG